MPIGDGFHLGDGPRREDGALIIPIPEVQVRGGDETDGSRQVGVSGPKSSADSFGSWELESTDLALGHLHCSFLGPKAVALPGLLGLGTWERRHGLLSTRCLVF